LTISPGRFSDSSSDEEVVPVGRKPFGAGKKPFAGAAPSKAAPKDEDSDEW
jgi:hypothetical protein